MIGRAGSLYGAHGFINPVVQSPVLNTNEVEVHPISVYRPKTHEMVLLAARCAENVAPWTMAGA
jgi:hypothetical protein